MPVRYLNNMNRSMCRMGLRQQPRSPPTRRQPILQPVDIIKLLGYLGRPVRVGPVRPIKASPPRGFPGRGVVPPLVMGPSCAPLRLSQKHLAAHYGHPARCVHYQDGRHINPYIRHERHHYTLHMTSTGIDANIKSGIQAAHQHHSSSTSSIRRIPNRQIHLPRLQIRVRSARQCNTKSLQGGKKTITLSLGGG